jgi:hypothetical protein
MSLIPQPPPKAKLVAALMAASEDVIEEALSALSQTYGAVALKGPVFPFTYSDYYAAEMGENLVKVFCSFRGLSEPGEIVARKLEAVECERKFLVEATGSRRVNVDPGYVDAAKLVLATAKNAGHRVYISSGVYAEIELMYRCGAFVPLEWTYRDYREPATLEFFGKVRHGYLAELKEGHPFR